MIRRRIVFPKEVLLAFRIASIDPTQWLKEVVKRFEEKAGVLGPYEECYPGGPSNYFVFELEIQNSTNEVVLDRLELEVDSRIYKVATSLTDKEKVVLTKRVEEGKSLAQIAFELRVKPQTIVSFITTIKEKVKKVA
ncbi:MAG: hypothetical protein QW158_07885 [Nitrososphaerales archaeon]